MPDTGPFPRKCDKCGGVIHRPGTPIALTGNECTCNREVNLRTDRKLGGLGGMR